MKKAQAKVAVYIRFDPETYQKLEQAAEDHLSGLSVSAFVTKLAVGYVSKIQAKETV